MRLHKYTIPYGIFHPVIFAAVGESCLEQLLLCLLSSDDFLFLPLLLYLLELYQEDELSTFHLFVSIIYLHQHALMACCSSLWILIHYYHD